MRLLRRLSIILLLAVFIFQVVSFMRSAAPTSDEFSHHIASGYSHLVTRDFRMNPAMPPLPRLLSALPLYVLGANAPLDHESWEKGDSPEFARQFFYRYNKQQDLFVFWARFPILLLGCLFAWFVFVWARLLFGVLGGFAALFLFVFCPDIITHSGLATSDLSVSLFFFLTLFSFWDYLKRPVMSRVILTGFLTGLCFLSKFSAVLLFVFLPLIAVFSGRLRELRFSRTVLFLAVCFLTVWAGYFFEIKPLLTHTPDPQKKIEFLNSVGGPRLVNFAASIPIPLSTFTSAFGSMMFTKIKGTNAFLMGHWSTQGWWYYYFVAFAIKNTIPLLVFIALALVLFKRLKLDRVTASTILVPIVLFFIVTMPDKSQAGIRYFLPIYPLLFILAAAGVVFLWNSSQKILRAIVILLLFWHAAEAARIYPHYLAYFNQFVGGPSNGYKFLRDSNIDWGQDLKGLGEYVKKKRFDEVALFYYGSADPAYYGIPARGLGEDEFQAPRQAVYAIAAHHIDSVKWTSSKQPVKVIGHSIFVYDFR